MNLGATYDNSQQGDRQVIQARCRSDKQDALCKYFSPLLGYCDILLIYTRCEPYLCFVPMASESQASFDLFATVPDSRQKAGDSWRMCSIRKEKIRWRPASYLPSGPPRRRHHRLSPRRSCNNTPSDWRRTSSSNLETMSLSHHTTV